MRRKKVYASNIGKYSFFAIIVFLTVGLFFLVILKFNSLDTNKYAIKAGSTFYDPNYNYLKSENDSYIAQRLDGNYYWYTNESNKKNSKNIGQNPIIYNKNDYKLYLYGNCYQVMSTGEVKTLSKNTEIPKASPTKFFKIKDRKYLMVDSSLKTDDNSIKTKGYLIIELDKQGNASFANNELNVKTIKPLILHGTTMKFDIANEKLYYGKKEIDVKNIIGSTNKYKKESPKTSTDKDKDKVDSSITKTEENKTTEITTVNNKKTEYYENYLKNVVNSVNNLTKSVTDVNSKTDNSVKKGEIYYDFSKYVALKNVSSSVSSITVSYAVVDSNNEYQNVFILIDDNKGNSNKYFLNKNETSYVVRNLNVDYNYKLSFGYKLVSSSEEVIEDVVNIKTKAPSCKISVTKVSRKALTYNVKVGSEYKFDSGEIHLYVDNIHSATGVVNMNKAVTTDGFSGSMGFDRLGNINTLKLENLVYNGSSVSLDCSYRFVS